MSILMTTTQLETTPQPQKSYTLKLSLLPSQSFGFFLPKILVQLEVLLSAKYIDPPPNILLMLWAHLANQF